MKINAKSRILELIRYKDGISPGEICLSIKISAVAVHRSLKVLLAENLIEKRGKAPRTLYVAKSKHSKVSAQLQDPQREAIEKNFCYFTPSGVELNGQNGFFEFLVRTNQAQDIQGRAEEYCKILATAEQFKDRYGIIDSTQKIHKTFNSSVVAGMYYSDFYSLPKYGKSKLGQYLLHGKSGQQRDLIEKIYLKTKEDVQHLLRSLFIDAVAFVPHSIPRKLSFLKEYERLLGLHLPKIKLIKAFSGDVPVAQKSLSKLSERQENARQTIFVKDSNIAFKRILIVDDALGSGSTVHEVAIKIKAIYPESTVYGYAIVGSYKGFDVIKEA